MFDAAIDDASKPGTWDDFDAGRAGLLYAASFLRENLGREAISRDQVVQIARAVVSRGQALSPQPQQYLEWISPNDGKRWLGTSHGSAGVLSQLLDVPELLQKGSDTLRLIVGTLDHIVANQLPSGNFPSEYYAPTDDVLVQVCLFSSLLFSYLLFSSLSYFSLSLSLSLSHMQPLTHLTWYSGTTVPRASWQPLPRRQRCSTTPTIRPRRAERRTALGREAW